MRKRTKHILLISVVLFLFVSYLSTSSLFGNGSNDDDTFTNYPDTGLFYLDYINIEAEDNFGQIEIVGNTLFLGQGVNSKVGSLDISNPRNLIDNGYVNNVNDTSAMESDGNMLYITNVSGLFGLDVSDPSSPQLKGQYSTRRAHKMHAEGDYLYTINSDSIGPYFNIYNTSSDGIESLISNWTAPSTFINFETLLVEKNIAYLGYQDGVLLVNLSNPLEPTYINEIEVEIPTGMVIYNDVLYISDEFGLNCLNVSDPSNLQVIKVYVGEEYVLEDMISLEDVLFGKGKRAIQNSYQYMISVFDIKDPLKVSVITKNYDIIPDDMIIDGDILYALGIRFDDTVERSLDSPTITSVISIKISEFLDLDGTALQDTSNTLSLFDTKDMIKDGNFAYIADGISGLQIYNISNYMDPIHITTKDTAGSANDVASWGKVVYIADGTNGIRAINIAQKNNPIEVTYNDTTGYAHSLFAKDYLLYEADGEDGLRIFNITDPYSLNQTGSIDTPGNATDVEVFEKIAYVADWNGGIRCIDVSNPYDPQEIGSLVLASNAYNLKIYRNYAYVACGTSGVRIININDPNNPVEVGSYSASGNVTDITISGKVAYISVSNSKTQWLNLSNPTTLTSIDYITNTNPINSIKLFDDLLFTASDSNGMQITKIKRSSNDDFDKDNLNYLSEIWNYNTNIDSNDTDGDGMDDEYECQFYTAVPPSFADSAFEFTIRATVHDSNYDADYDQLTNLQEYNLGTNPFSYDTDKDKVDDYTEIEQGFDPLDNTSFPEKMDWTLIILAILLVVTIAYVAMSTLGVFEKKAPLNIFLSHAVIDFEPFRIKEMAETLGKVEAVNKGLYCELDMKGNIDDWMDEMVPLSHIFLFIATKKSVFNSVDCGREIRLAHEHGLFMIPIRTNQVEWKDIESINLPNKGFDYPEGKPDALYKQIEDYIQNLAENMEKVKKQLNKSDIVTLDILDEQLELEKGVASKLAKILIKSGRIVGAITKDGNQFLSEFELNRRIKLYKKSSATLEISEIMDSFDIDDLYEHEVSQLIDKKKKSKKIREIVDETESKRNAETKLDVNTEKEPEN